MQEVKDSIKIDAPLILTNGAVKQLNKIMDSEKLAFVVPYGDDDE